MPFSKLIIGVVLVVVVGGYLYYNSRQFKLPRGETTILETPKDQTITASPKTVSGQGGVGLALDESERKIFVTDGTKHSVPLDEILSGGPPKDGIPSIDKPKFISPAEASEWLKDDEAGTGLCVGADCRFYPYLILVWHEIVNDTVADQPVLVTYCPLCLTGIVFERRLDNKAVEFGTSGKLWKSNLVMYNRAAVPRDESLWSQVLGEAIVGKLTGTRLKIVPSDVIKYGDWKKLHPDTKVLSKDTGIKRAYGYDPYGDYYTSNDVSFGASFDDGRLHPKEFVLGVNINGKYKAYQTAALKVGETRDTFNGETIVIDKKPEGEVRMFRGTDRRPLPYIGGFWFSWLNAHPGTELFK